MVSELAKFANTFQTRLQICEPRRYPNAAEGDIPQSATTLNTAIVQRKSQITLALHRTLAHPPSRYGFTERPKPCDQVEEFRARTYYAGSLEGTRSSQLW